MLRRLAARPAACCRHVQRCKLSLVLFFPPGHCATTESSPACCPDLPIKLTGCRSLAPLAPQRRRSTCHGFCVHGLLFPIEPSSPSRLCVAHAAVGSPSTQHNTCRILELHPDATHPGGCARRRCLPQRPTPGSSGNAPAFHTRANMHQCAGVVLAHIQQVHEHECGSAPLDSHAAATWRRRPAEQKAFGISTAPPTRAHPRLFRTRTLLLGLLPGRLQGRLCETRRTMATPTPTGTAAPFKVRTNAAGALIRCRAGLTSVGGRPELARPRSARPAPDLGCRHMYRRLGAQQGPQRPLATISSGRPWTLAALAPAPTAQLGGLTAVGGWRGAGIPGASVGRRRLAPPPPPRGAPARRRTARICDSGPPPRPPCHPAAPLQHAAELIANAKAIATPGKGILAADESTGTIGKRVSACPAPALVPVLCLCGAAAGLGPRPRRKHSLGDSFAATQPARAATACQPLLSVPSLPAALP